jgi:hypothetical protein
MLEHRKQWIKATISLGRRWNVITCQFQISHVHRPFRLLPPPPKKLIIKYQLVNFRVDISLNARPEHFREIIITTEGQVTKSESFYGPECTGFRYMTMRKPGLSAELLYVRSLSQSRLQLHNFKTIITVYRLSTLVDWNRTLRAEWRCKPADAYLNCCCVLLPT